MKTRHLLFLALCGAAGCSTLKTTEATRSEPLGTKPVTGLYYFLPRGKITISGKPAQAANPAYTVTLTAVNEADPAERYFLSHRSNLFADDDIKLAVNEKGLLKTVNVTSEDKTGAILADLAEVGANVLRFMTAAKVERGKGSFSYTFDPFDTRARAAVIAGVKAAAGIELSVSIPELTKARTALKAGNGPASVGGVLFRPAVPVVLEFALANDGDTQKQRLTFLLPDPAALIAFDLSRSAFIKKVTHLVFVDGMLQEMSVTKPSQAQAVIGIPKTLVKTLVPLPLELKQIQINTVAKERELIDAKKALRKAQQNR